MVHDISSKAKAKAKAKARDERPLRMNSNNYLGMALRSEVVAVEEAAAASYGVGPGAVRFISGTWSSHVASERRLAAFHDRRRLCCSPRLMPR